MTYIIDAIHAVKSKINKIVEKHVVEGDDFPRFQYDSSGKLQWGSGSGAIDTVLERSSSGILNLSTGAFQVGGIAMPIRVAKIAFGADELGGSETNTSFTYPASGAIQLFAWWEVTDGESGTMDVGTQGTSNDPDGLLDGVDLTNVGVFTPNAVTTTGLNQTYISGMTYGALSHRLFVGADEAGEPGSIVWRPQFITGADPVSITSSGDLNSCSGYVYLAYVDLAAF